MIARTKKIVILGGGPCGLYAARVLSHNGYSVTVLDKGERPGGLATGMHCNKNWYDFGVHMLHAFDQEIFADVKELMGAERIEADLNAYIKWAGGSYRYPLKFQDVLKHIPLFKFARQVLGLFGSQLRNLIFPYQAANAEEALIQLYGKPLYKFFFEGFTYRYWGIHPKELSATFVATKMPKLSAVDIIKKSLEKVGIKNKGKSVESPLVNETLHYSRSGAEAMTRCLAKAITDSKSTVILNAEVKQIKTSNNKVTSVIYHKKNTLQEIDCDACISTIPINQLVKIIQPTPATEILQAANNLRYKPTVIVGLLVKKQRCLEALYIYYRDHIFHRIGEPKNAGMLVTPTDHTVLIIEMTCEIGDAKWNMGESIKQRLYQELADENICKPEDIAEFHVIRCETGYPIFALGFENHLKTIKDYIANFSNLQTTGRQGGFAYPNMHSAMRMGAEAAKHLMRDFS